MTTAIPRLYAAKGWAWEDTGVSLMARIYGQDAALVTQASVSSIALSVFDITDPASPIAIATDTPSASSVVFDTLQTDARWTKDATGYNFRYATAATHMPAGGKTYVWEFKVTPTSGQPWHEAFLIQAGDLNRS